MFDKQLLIEKLGEKISGKSRIVSQAAEKAKQETIEAEGRMQTRYGSSKEETGYLADGLNLRRMELDKATRDLGLIRVVNGNETVGNGSLMRLQSQSGEIENYLILPYGGGEELETNGDTVTVVTPNSPIVRLALNKRKGDIFKLGTGAHSTKYKVVEVL
jgi:transcription elongation GreA/GreB family factor